MPTTLTIEEEHERRVDEAIVVESERRLQDFCDEKVAGIPVEEAMRRVRKTVRQSECQRSSRGQAA